MSPATPERLRLSGGTELAFITAAPSRNVSRLLASNVCESPHEGADGPDTVS
jgi:hypothetical protein